MIARVQSVIGSSAVVLSLVISMAMGQVPMGLRGTIESVDSRTLRVKARDGTMTRVKLADGAQIFTLNKVSVADVKQGSLVGVTASQQMDGSLKAVEIYILLGKPLLEPSSMTGTSVAGRGNEILSYMEGAVLSNDTQALTIKYEGGEKKISLSANVRVVNFVSATVSEIKPGLYFFVPNSKPVSQGTLASTLIIGSDRVDFAM